MGDNDCPDGGCGCPDADCPSALHLPCRSEFVYSIMVTNSVLERFVWCIRDFDKLSITIY